MDLNNLETILTVGTIALGTIIFYGIIILYNTASL